MKFNKHGIVSVLKIKLVLDTSADEFLEFKLQLVPIVWKEQYSY